jgi:hypothetical protein
MSSKHPIMGELARQIAVFDSELSASRAYSAEVATRADTLATSLNRGHGREPVEGLRLDAETIKALESDTKHEAELLSADHAAFVKSGRPQALVDRWRQRLVLGKSGSRAGSLGRRAGLSDVFHIPTVWLPLAPPPTNTQLTPPAISCDSSGAQCDSILGDMNLRVTSSGGGGAWGLLATASGPPDFASLRFMFTPAAGGDLYVTARVDISGTVYVVAHDHWYTSTSATAKLTIGCRLFQQYRDDGPSMVIVNENRTDSSAAYWVVDSFYPSASTTVDAGVPVLIDVWATLEGHGHSDHATVDCDFASGADNHIRVPNVDVVLVPF